MLPNAAEAHAGSDVLDSTLRAYNLTRDDLFIYIDKTRHTLTLKAGRLTLKQYRCVFGTNPVADKKFEGDRCTPEGVFHIIDKGPNMLWDKFMLIDYPTADSWSKFKANKQAGLIKPNARIGGSIGIHGVPKDRLYLVDKGINWTYGCISLSNPDVEDLYQYVGKGTTVIISK